MTRMLVFALLSLVGCAASSDVSAGTQPSAPVAEGQAEAVFAGGCFWCMESEFEKLPGVVEVESGYTGGAEKNPTYEDVGHHRTTHYEAIRVVYDPQVVDYDALLVAFWHNVDPTQDNGQFCDKGDQYRTGIFTSDADEQAKALASREVVRKQLDRDVVTQVMPAATFWVAEEYHQDFYEKKPQHYMRYRIGCGRDARLQELWGSSAGHGG